MKDGNRQADSSNKTRARQTPSGLRSGDRRDGREAAMMAGVHVSSKILQMKTDGGAEAE